MADDFFLGFAAHAHTKNELETDSARDEELRRRNSTAEARKLTEMVTERLAGDIAKNGFELSDTKLLVLYVSYRGETKEKDKSLCESILATVREGFQTHSPTDLPRLIGHTTACELENEDLDLREVSGIGFNGLSLLALVTNFPIGVGRTWGLQTAIEAGEQGKEMANAASIDFSHQTSNKEQLQIRKTMIVLTHGSTVDTPGFEPFLAEGITKFIDGNRQTRIMNVIGGSSGDGIIGKVCHQFYGRPQEHPKFAILEGEAVCALIPNLSEPSVGLDVGWGRTIGRPHRFQFNAEKEPHFKYVKRIGNEDPSTKLTEMIYNNEAQLCKEKGLPLPDKKAIFQAIQDSRDQKKLLLFDPIVGKYGVAFPFGNYSANALLRLVGDDLELIHPVRSYTPEMPGYLLTADYTGVEKGARNICTMLGAGQAFNKNDTTIIVSCIGRRTAELTAGRSSGTEAEIIKEALSSTQVIGFLGYGEISFTHLTQEPYFHAGSCWGLTFHSKRHEPNISSAKPKMTKKELGIKGWLRGSDSS